VTAWRTTLQEEWRSRSVEAGAAQKAEAEAVVVVVGAVAFMFLVFWVERNCPDALNIVNQAEQLKNKYQATITSVNRPTTYMRRFMSDSRPPTQI
jgi:hypothetical protein